MPRFFKLRRRTPRVEEEAPVTPTPWTCEPLGNPELPSSWHVMGLGRQILWPSSSSQKGDGPRAAACVNALAGVTLGRVCDEDYRKVIRAIGSLDPDCYAALYDELVAAGYIGASS